jgi:UDP-N-acetylglucosamine:LPS N-acetylglucosamine transferase
VVGFTTDMKSMYAWSDVVIARSGRTTVADLECVGRKSVLVPIYGPHTFKVVIQSRLCRILSANHWSCSFLIYLIDPKL